MEHSQETSLEDKIDINSLDDELDESSKVEEEKRCTSLDRVIELTQEMGVDTNKALDMINTINRKTEFLAINALIEASRSGDSDNGFQVVAESIDVLAQKTKEAVETMRKETIAKMDDLGKVIKTQSQNVRGNRLSDLALGNIDLIDRNLYERTADIRWWATDDVLVKALSQKNPETLMDAQLRLNVILKSYTVYLDLVVVDLDGNPVTNALHNQFDLTGRSFAGKSWFQDAMRTTNGEEYAFQGVHKSSISGKYTMTFSCKIHENGDTSQRPIGILASVFNWESLSKKIIDETPLNDDEKDTTRVCIIDDENRILADTYGKFLEKISFPQMDELFNQKKSFNVFKQKGEKTLVCHGGSPGYESFSSGWHSVIFRTLNQE